MPISGTIAAVNETLQGDPALINKEPYVAGWMIKILPSNIAELDALLSAQDYAKVTGGGLSPCPSFPIRTRIARQCWMS